jgi:hypothetical protein
MLRTSSARGGAGIIVLTALTFLAVWALIWLALTWGTGRFRASYVWMKACAGDEAWAEFGGNRMRIASTRAGLAQAKWIDATVTGWNMAEFPPVAAPITPSGWQQRWDSSMLSFTVGPAPTVTWQLAKSDLSGSIWAVAVSRRLTDGDSLDTAPVNEIPALGKPTLTIDARPKHEGDESKIDIEVAMAGENWTSFSLTRDGSPLPIRVRVLDDSGGVVSDKSGPIETFGHT